MNDQRHLSWFLGPKAENAELFEELLLAVVRDYLHWRRNYFPGDPILITRSMQRDLAPDHDILTQHVQQLMAELRRNFPFYSPRYIAHELSDTLLPSMLGYIAGLLFNPNNVTPEAAPVTTEQEIFACARILEMLGYAAPPDVPNPSENAYAYYTRQSANEFGWAHLTSGGTVANIEALWVARQVRYFPLAVRETATRLDLSMEVQLPNGDRRDLRSIDPYDLLLLKTNESIYMLPKYIEAIKQRPEGRDLSGEALHACAWAELENCQYSLSKGVAQIFSEFRPVILIAGTRHYSWTKAANILGLGQESLVHVKTDKHFRLDASDLRKKLLLIKQKREVPLCVVATAGTTEEGAVDPLHEIVDVRSSLETTESLSFWIHVDAAWGGFIRSLFSFSMRDELLALVNRISRQLSIETNDDLPRWHDSLTERLKELAHHPPRPQTDADTTSGVGGTEPDNQTDRFQQKIQQHLNTMRSYLEADDYKKYMELLEQIPDRLRGRQAVEVLGEMRMTNVDRVGFVRQFVSDRVELRHKGNSKLIKMNWPDPEVGSAFLAFPKSDSITVDPHKMGYGLYPGGCVAFRNDRARLFVMQRAPYITSAERNPRFHLPPRHSNLVRGAEPSRHIITESFSPFILEGSRPGAAASALWLSLQTIPLTMREHGLVVRESILAARELYEWLIHMNGFLDQEKHGVDFKFIPLTAQSPDTNIVTFVVKKKTSRALSDLNRLTRAVYNHFSIQSELGERQYSYAQPFFLSHTRLTPQEYPVEVLNAFFCKCEMMTTSTVQDYGLKGMDVLRATVMNPYIRASRRITGQNFPREFVEELSRQAAIHVRTVD